MDLVTEYVVQHGILHYDDDARIYATLIYYRHTALKESFTPS